MADTRKITIEILSGDNVSTKSKKEKKPENEIKKAIDKKLHPIKNSKFAETSAYIVLNQAWQQTKQRLTQAADFSIGRYYSLTEDYLAQTNYQNIKTIIGKGSNAASSIIGGTITGSYAGPVGAAFGFVIGAASWYAGEYIQNKSNLSSYYQDLNATNFNTQYSQTRAGLINGGRGTEN